jgi:hypothetical protein
MIASAAVGCKRRLGASARELLDVTAFIESKIAEFSAVSFDPGAQDALPVEEQGRCNAATDDRIVHVDPAFLIHWNIPVESITQE